MNSFETILVLLALLAGLSVLFQRSRLPQAVLLVAAGERWPNGTLMPAREDEWGAGAVNCHAENVLRA